MQHTKQARFPIGTKYTVQRSKQGKKEYTIEDIHYTYNYAGDLVKLRYVAYSVLMGQKVYDYDVVETTIAKALYTK